MKTANVDLFDFYATTSLLAHGSAWRGFRAGPFSTRGTGNSSNFRPQTYFSECFNHAEDILGGASIKDMYVTTTNSFYRPFEFQQGSRKESAVIQFDPPPPTPVIPRTDLAPGVSDYKSHYSGGPSHKKNIHQKIGPPTPTGFTNSEFQDPVKHIPTRQHAAPQSSGVNLSETRAKFADPTLQTSPPAPNVSSNRETTTAYTKESPKCAPGATRTIRGKGRPSKSVNRPGRITPRDSGVVQNSSAYIPTRQCGGSYLTITKSNYTGEREGRGGEGIQQSWRSGYVKNTNGALI